MRKLENEPIRTRLERDLEEIRALIEKMRTVIGVQDLGEVFIQPEIDFSQPAPDPTTRPMPSPAKAFMDLMIYILENR